MEEYASKVSAQPASSARLTAPLEGRVVGGVAIDVWADTVQTVAVALGAGAAIFAWRQVRLSKHGGGGANVLDLWANLQSETARDNRRKVYQAHEARGPFVAGPRYEGPHSWGREEMEAAQHVAQLLSVAGALAKYDYVPLALLKDEWGPMIVRLFALVKPVMALDRARRNDPRDNYNFEWLAHECGYQPSP